jgi:hypothetical protein
MRLLTVWNLPKITVSLEDGIAGGGYSMQACHPLQFLRQKLYSLFFLLAIFARRRFFFQIEKNCSWRFLVTKSEKCFLKKIARFVYVIFSA